VDTHTFSVVSLAVIGLFVGSFLNVCIWRIPRGQSIVFPSSRCPSCEAPIKPWDNIPVLSYAILGGKCRNCGVSISARYPLVEAANASLYLLVFWRFGPGWHLPVYLAFVSSLIVITFIDLDFQIIPDRITLPWIPLGLLAGSFVAPDPFSREVMLGWSTSLIGAALGFGLFYLIAVVSRGGMGGGDVKFMAGVGALLGWKGVLLTTFSGSLTGSVVGILLIRLKGKGRKTKIPFGPFLTLGAIVSLFFGEEILAWYLHAGR
jgi:leader peptidase (prepilin peptidase)/N-methyltransferase